VAGQVSSGEWIAARYRTGEWKARQGCAGTIEELIARGAESYKTVLDCLRAQLRDSGDRGRRVRSRREHRRHHAQ
jgi:hypothetical protein